MYVLNKISVYAFIHFVIQYTVELHVHTVDHRMNFMKMYYRAMYLTLLSPLDSDNHCLVDLFDQKTLCIDELVTIKSVYAII